MSKGYEQNDLPHAAAEPQSTQPCLRPTLTAEKSIESRGRAPNSAVSAGLPNQTSRLQALGHSRSLAKAPGPVWLNLFTMMLPYASPFGAFENFSANSTLAYVRAL